MKALATTICLLILIAPEVCRARNARVFYLVITDRQVQCIKERLKLEAKLNAAYVWGAAKLKVGAPGDCSGKLSAVCQSCGVRVRRMRARDMGEGLDGWNFPEVTFEQAKALAIVIMTLQKKRPNGHVGMLAKDVYGGRITLMAHASSRWGFMLVNVEKSKKNYFYSRITKIRQMQWK
jgi:hypothetical protein